MDSLVGRRRPGVESSWRHGKNLALLVLIACGVLTGCDDSKGAGNAGPDAGPGPEVPATVLQLASTGACRIDEECAADLHCFQGACVFECNTDADCEEGASCSPRRRCEAGEGEAGKAATPEVVPGVHVMLPPPEVVRVAPGQKEVKLTFKTTAPVGAGVLGYTVEAYSHKSKKATPPQQVFRAKGSDSFEIVVPTGSAGAMPKRLITKAGESVEGEEGEGPGIEEVQIVTSVGTFRTKLLPEPTASGRYAGTVTASRFGQVGLPIDFEIVTDPIDAAPEDAAHVYLVLPVQPGSIYSPISPSQSESTHVAVELQFQEFTRTWIGTTRAPFDFGQDSTLARYGAGKVMRSLRFELTFHKNALTGKLRDNWEGLYDARTADGVASLATVVFDGKVDMTRVGKSRELAELPALHVRNTEAVAARPLPDVESACPDELFAVDDVTVDGEVMSCAGIASASDFFSASAAEQASCAVAVAENALSGGKTTAALIAAFLSGDSAVTGEESFSDFMRRCAAGTNGACRPTPEVLCGRALTAYSATVQLEPDPRFGAVYDAYTRSTRETFLGVQLAAHQSDADTRLSWLKALDYPAIVTSAVRELNERLLNEWRSLVLDAHFAVLNGQYDELGLSVLSRQVAAGALTDQRQLLLTEMTQSWRGAMEALTVAARRWNDLYQDSGSRAMAAEFISGRAFDLYVLSGVVDDLNVAAGSAYASFGMAAGFASLLNELRRLALPFNALIFDRDAEVVVSKSLNPLRGDDQLLADLEDTAKKEIEKASAMVDVILARAQEQAVNEQLLRDELNNQVNQAFDELVTLCGLPLGCRSADREKPECWPVVQAGQCGFGVEVVNKGTTAQPDLEVTVVGFSPTSNVSEASQALLELQMAENVVAESEVALAKYREVTNLMLETNEARDAELKAAKTRADMIEAEVQKKWAEIRAGEQERLAAIDAWYEDLKEARNQAYNERQAAADNIYNTRRNNTEADIRELRAVAGLQQSSAAIKAAVERAEKLTEITADGIPETPDGAGAPLRAAVKAVAFGATSVMDIAAQGLELSAAIVETQREIRNLTAEDKLADLERRADLALLAKQNEIDDIEAQLTKALEHNAVKQQQALDFIAQLEQEFEADQQYARDLEALYNRRDDIHARIVEELDRSLALQQAQYTVTQRQLAYASIVQRAQLLEGRLRNLVAQRNMVNLNLGSPSVVFGWANQLEQAENRLARAKSKLMDWVVALEYLAVRPFMDARIQVLLARNTYQLSEIADSLTDIQNRCGGAINSNETVLSLREDILRLDAGLRDAVSGGELTPAEAFRAILKRGMIAADTRVRFSADSTIGDLVSRGGVLAASFDVNLSDFANLGATCNAKVQEIALQLVGEGLGTAQPTVGLAYDGTSAVRSCQPDIEDIVDAIGPEATAFGAITMFRTPGRVLAPIAGINEFGQANQTLIGLPLASRYTVIIDPTLGRNASIHWDNLEDVKILFRFASQDFYPAGQCH